MLVEWTMPNVYSVWTQNATKPVRLMPGNNELEDKVWDKIKAHPNVQLHMDEGNLVVLDKPSGDRKQKAEGLKQYDVAGAKRVVKKTYDKVLLGKWLEMDERKAVQTEIKAQIKKVDESVKLKTDEQEDG